MTGKLSRKALEKALETVPMTEILGKDVSRELTAKQKRFALEVAKGNTKAEAYRTAYKRDASKRTIVAKPYELARDERIKREIEAYQVALEAAKYRTPAALRELVVQSLVNVVINPETKDSVKVAAAKVLGTVTEVAAFTERKEIRTIKSADETRSQVLNQIRELMKSNATDANIIERDADALLAEIAGGTSAGMGEDETHPPATPQAEQQESHAHIHTIPPQRSDSSAVPPHPSSSGSLSVKGDSEETPPLDGTGDGQNGGA
jgi:hypothetical protein